jgi:hypothetical protein
MVMIMLVFMIVMIMVIMIVMMGRGGRRDGMCVGGISQRSAMGGVLDGHDNRLRAYFR